MPRTMNHKDYSNRQQKRSPLSPPTVNRLWAADSTRCPLRSCSANTRSTGFSTRSAHNAVSACVKRRKQCKTKQTV